MPHDERDGSRDAAGPRVAVDGHFPGPRSRNKDPGGDDGWPIRGLRDVSLTNQRIRMGHIVIPVSQKLPVQYGKQMTVELNKGLWLVI